MLLLASSCSLASSHPAVLEHPLLGQDEACDLESGVMERIAWQVLPPLLLQPASSLLLSCSSSKQSPFLSPPPQLLVPSQNSPLCLSPGHAPVCGTGLPVSFAKSLNISSCGCARPWHRAQGPGFWTLHFCSESELL